MTTAATTLLLARVHARMLRQQALKLLGENRLMALTVTAFLGIYILSSYLLVSRGITFVGQLPLLGSLLTERLIYLLFFFFFVMLVVSNATITGIALFRPRDTAWQHALPMRPRALVLWKTLEGMLLASWGMLVLSTPILAAFGHVFEDGPTFYATGLTGLLCMVILCANVSTWVLLILVRWARPWWWKPVLLLAVGLLIVALHRFWTTLPEEAQARDVVGNLNEVLRHTEICMHPLLPSTWVAEALTAAGHGMMPRSGFFLLVLVAQAAFSFVITAWLGTALFPAAWQRVMTQSAADGPKRGWQPWFSVPHTPASGHRLRRIFRLDRRSTAVLVKDIRAFLREPVQWGQCVLIFGLLFFYMSNLRRLGYDLSHPFWIYLVSYLNLVVCSLALSTLTTRFIYPQFSMEGRRLWIIGPSPVPLHRLLGLKLRLSGSVIAVAAGILLFISSTSLSLPLVETLFFCAAIILMSYGLTALALALGALAPNFREPNPARIVSGFGGTLCLIASFIYILLSISIVVAPAWRQLQPNPVRTPPPHPEIENVLLSLVGLVALTLAFGAFPYFLAKNRTKKLEYLRDL
ncbi:MAG: hypothetical protein KDK99_07670 [Verrucomicrobiales bacterium]|nr:hypothetical protein [Verrucomicrobiales bacterium]